MYSVTQSLLHVTVDITLRRVVTILTAFQMENGRPPRCPLVNVSVYLLLLQIQIIIVKKSLHIK